MKTQAAFYVMDHGLSGFQIEDSKLLAAIEDEAVELYKTGIEAERKALSDHKCAVAEIPGDYYAKDPWQTDSAHCTYPGCRRDLGWYCPASEDHRCHYSRSLDCCDYCGQPEERK